MTQPSMERIVRPFETEPVFKPRVFLPQNATPRPDGESEETVVVIKVVGAGDTDLVATDNPFTGGSLKSEWEEDKSKRKTEQVRVENPDDPDQYLVVDRIKNMTLREKRSGSTINIAPSW